MCGSCGCEETGRTVTVQERVLDRNDHLAEHNRAWLADRAILAVNLMSSPGSGKTTLLERAIEDLRDRLTLAVIEGDQATPLDADRIRATGCPAVQINTGAGCHLDAAMLAGALRDLGPAPGSVVFVENVGNLVCPAMFDLGEDHRAVVMSVTEGADKPLKYPHMFRTADVVLLNKVDLLPHVDFDPDRFRDLLRQVNTAAAVLPVSATRGDGLGEWYSWLAGRRRVLAAAVEAML
ncbi:hydrogenase nickel incorporation protein HypB [Amycolatopsis taiwanensis]|uniref:Hydrogenase accessory protein HypB n=1 Tax=Amycolatopsis taiwanensis TaxID=342230 RepID=A0A9W6VIV0_9PSEU|nr:hydrogenase nickel incorporation protein HypB [Amycolatopsis taiwanensis]GLY70070.1 hydrogenase accessory protein HypB [Amycolatopsis taiwanensis]